MIRENNSQHLSAGLMAIMLLSLMYSFGTFGLLNLFGVRTLVQVALLGVITLLFIVMRVKFRVDHLMILLLFSGAYVAGSLIFSFQINSLILMYILIFCFVLFFYSPPKHLIYFCKALVLATTIICILVLIASIYYQINPDQANKANFSIYHSDVGSKRIYPGHFMDFISFTSGDGFSVMGRQMMRMKGYSNEPSSTIVHYFAPAALAFLLGGRYLYLGVFILAVNMITIVSFTAYIILIISLGFFTLKFIPKMLSKILFFVVICVFVYVILNPVIIFGAFRYFSLLAIDIFGLDLLSRKIGNGSETSNLGSRQLGIINGFKSTLTSPLGFSQEKLGTGSGLFYEVGSRAGWIGVLIFGAFMTSFIKNIRVAYFKAPSLTYLYGISLLVGILLVTLFISGYGWDRPPGVVMMLLYFRVLQILASENNDFHKLTTP